MVILTYIFRIWNGGENAVRWREVAWAIVKMREHFTNPIPPKLLK